MHDERETNRRNVLKAAGAGIAGVALTGSVTAKRGGLQRELAEVRSATAAYNDPANAYEDGYVAHGEDGAIPLEDVVDEAHSVCGMGFHFANMERIGSVDPTEPAVLAYGVGDDGDLVLGAVEYIVPKAGPYEEEPPSLFDHSDSEEAWEEDSPFPGVWSLHAWVHTHNPEGVFSPFNHREVFSPDGCESHH